MHKMWNSSKFLENSWKNLAHGPQFGPMGLSNFQIQRLGRAWAKMIRPRPIVGQTPKLALLRPGPGQAGPGPGPNSSLVFCDESCNDPWLRRWLGPLDLFARKFGKEISTDIIIAEALSSHFWAPPTTSLIFTVWQKGPLSCRNS